MSKNITFDKTYRENIAKGLTLTLEQKTRVKYFKFQNKA